MINKAVKNGVKPERIAAALNLELKQVLASMNLLEGIHPEAVDLLKDKPICPKAIGVLRRVTQIRQIEMVELMVSVNTFPLCSQRPRGSRQRISHWCSNTMRCRHTISSMWS